MHPLKMKGTGGSFGGRASSGMAPGVQCVAVNSPTLHALDCDLEHHRFDRKKQHTYIVDGLRTRIPARGPRPESAQGAMHAPDRWGTSPKRSHADDIRPRFFFGAANDAHANAI